MKKQILKTLTETKQLLNKDKVLPNEINLLKTKIEFYQHERLIHLIVTVFVGIVAILFLIASLQIENIFLTIIFVLLLLLFIPYIFHYYFLENSIQELYELYNSLQQKNH